MKNKEQFKDFLIQKNLVKKTKFSIKKSMVLL